MSTHNWNQFRLRIPVRASAQKIFDAWSTQQGLQSWFLRKSEFTKPDGSKKNEASPVEVNDTYFWLWHGWPDDVSEKGTILETNGKNRLKFSFGKAGNVTVTVKEEAGEQVCELEQDEIPTDENSQVYYHIGCSRGWLFYMTNLKSILEGGIDLRNRNLDLKEVINS